MDGENIMEIDFKDEALTDCLNGIISGLLPHENYDPSSFSLLYPTLKTVLNTPDTRGLYYAIYLIFDKYTSLATSLPRGAFEIRITRERFQNAVENNLPDLILEPRTDVPSLMAEEGKSSDLNIPTVQQEVMGVLYEKLMALYDDCFNLKQSYDDAMSRVIDLKDILKANIIETGMGLQRAIMSVGQRVGRKFYRGPQGWLEFVQNLSRTVSEMERSDDGDLECNGIEYVNVLDQSTQELYEPLANYGIPQLDDFTPMLKHRLVVMVARENTGKTQVVIHLIASLIRAGVKPFFACGEAPQELMFSCIVSSYIYQEYGMFFETQYLSGEGYDQLTPEDKQVVNTAKARVASSGLVISNNLEYDNVVSKVTHYYNKGCEAFFFDHTQSLRGRRGRKIGDLVTGLALDCRELKNELPIYICLTSQPSTGLKDLLQKDQLTDMQLSPTAQSATPSQEADELFILSENEYLKTQGLLSWITYKRRGARRPKPLYILKHFNVSAFEYDPEYQGVEAVSEGTLDGLVASIATDSDDIDVDGEMDIEF